MDTVDGQWIMRGLSRNDPRRVKTVEELLCLVDEVGFLPLFSTEIPGFSLEERTCASDWWCDDPKIDPWLWREIAAESGRCVYGHFFARKAGFVSLKVFPAFMNVRRDGYPFDALWDDGKASFREKKIMDWLPPGTEMLSTDLKVAAGFGKGGEKNFSGTVAGLMEKTYLCVSCYRKRRNKQGLPFGWPIGVYTTPETRFREAFLEPGYENEPEADKQALTDFLHSQYPGADRSLCEKIIGG